MSLDKAQPSCPFPLSGSAGYDRLVKILTVTTIKELHLMILSWCLPAQDIPWFFNKII